jgi:hypothetical protein
VACTLKATLRTAVPLAGPRAVAPLPPQPRPFARAVFSFPYNDRALLGSLLSIVRRVNARALGFLPAAVPQPAEPSTIDPNQAQADTPSAEGDCAEQNTREGGRADALSDKPRKGETAGEAGGSACGGGEGVSASGVPVGLSAEEPGKCTLPDATSNSEGTPRAPEVLGITGIQAQDARVLPAGDAKGSEGFARHSSAKTSFGSGEGLGGARTCGGGAVGTSEGEEVVPAEREGVSLEAVQQLEIYQFTPAQLHDADLDILTGEIWGGLGPKSSAMLAIKSLSHEWC